MQGRDLPVFIVDTHSLYWFQNDPSQLSAAADAVFRLAAAGGGRIVVPAIVVAEFYYLTQKLGLPVPPSALLADINESREFVFSELGEAQLEMMEEVAEVPEMHDRLIIAEALVHQAPVISRDEAIRASGLVEVIW